MNRNHRTHTLTGPSRRDERMGMGEELRAVCRARCRRRPLQRTGTALVWERGRCAC